MSNDDRDPKPDDTPDPRAEVTRLAAELARVTGERDEAREQVKTWAARMRDMADISEGWERDRDQARADLAAEKEAHDATRDARDRAREEATVSDAALKMIDAALADERTAHAATRADRDEAREGKRVSDGALMLAMEAANTAVADLRTRYDELARLAGAVASVCPSRGLRDDRLHAALVALNAHLASGGRDG